MPTCTSSARNPNFSGIDGITYPQLTATHHALQTTSSRIHATNASLLLQMHNCHFTSCTKTVTIHHRFYLRKTIHKKISSFLFEEKDARAFFFFRLGLSFFFSFLFEQSAARGAWADECPGARVALQESPKEKRENNNRKAAGKTNSRKL